MPDIAAGVVKFQKEVFPGKQDLFDKLANRQDPETLFITCSDSRIDPNLLAQTEPGDLFIARNAGNMVPPHTKATGGMTASIEFAVAVLGVKHIVICGHSGCGAMKGAMDPDSVAALPHVSEWLGHSQAAVQVLEEKLEGKDVSNEEKLDLLIKENVLLQMQHLRTHPYVAAKLATGKIEIHGWVYDIKTGNVDAYDEDNHDFIAVEEHYAEHIATLAAQNH